MKKWAMFSVPPYSVMRLKCILVETEKNTEVLVVASYETGLVVNADKN